MSDCWVVRRPLATDATDPRACTASKETISTTTPSSNSATRPEAASHCTSKRGGPKFGSCRGKQRWSALVNAPTLRITKSMHARAD